MHTDNMFKVTYLKKRNNECVFGLLTNNYIRLQPPYHNLGKLNKEIKFR